MTPLAVKSLFVLCVLLLSASIASSDSDESSASVEVDDEEEALSIGGDDPPVKRETENVQEMDANGESGEKGTARRIVGTYEVDEEYASQDHHAAFRKRAKPLKNIFMGIYKNYKSTYLGNKTTMEYKQRLRDRNSATDQQTWPLDDVERDGEEGEVFDDEEEARVETVPTTEPPAAIMDEKITTSTVKAAKAETSSATSKSNDSTTEKKRRKRKQKPPTTLSKTQKRTKTKVPPPADVYDPLLEADQDEYRYRLGPGVNMTLDMSNDVVKVKLDGSNLRDILAGRWLADNTEQGRGKKYDMMTKVLPLFILPFLIQSAIVPFLVTKLKLLLVKSIVIGKLAIFLLIVSALKNSNKQQSYEVGPSYWASEPSRRSELPVAAASGGYGGYRVEGKPAWIN